MEPASSLTDLTPYEALTILAPTYARISWDWKRGQYGGLSLQDLLDLGCQDTVWRHVADYVWINVDKGDRYRKPRWQTPESVRAYVLQMVAEAKGRQQCSSD